MKRVLAILVVTLVVAGGAFAAMGAGSSEAPEYEIVFDNAFGLVTGADFKVGGVAVGSIEDVGLQRSDMRALVTVSATKRGGFAGLRSDATCIIAPQSLIGEYFVDCQPGTRGKVLETGATIPVRQTESPIPPDLVLNVMRLPVRQRFQIVLRELGAGLAARGDDLNETIKRAVPAIGATNRVLSVLAQNRQTLAALSRDSGQVLRVLGQRREDLGRFITTSRRLAETSAERRQDIAATFRRFPGFLDQLTPTMVDLGTAARLQAPALADLRAAAPSVTRLLTTLRPFTRALRPATRSLAEAAGSGRTAARESRDLLRDLAELGGTSVEPSNNLAIILEDLDDRGRAVEPDPDSPGGQGYTGLENPLQYVFDQVLALNLFDQRGYSLKINVNEGECAQFTDAAAALEDPGRYARCNQNLGPSQPAINQPDPSPPGGGTATARIAGRDRSAQDGRPGDEGAAPGADEPVPAAPGEPTPAPGVIDVKPPLPADLPPVQQLIDQLPKLLDPLDKTGKDTTQKAKKQAERAKEKLDELAEGLGAAKTGDSAQSAQDLLDFLLAP